jgi:RNA polymerase sigma-70 factor (ECF subfamily)
MTSTNTSLIRRLCSVGDDNSWTDFVNTYESMVRSYVADRSLRRGVRMDDHDLNAVVQSVWVKLWKHFDDFEFDKQRGRFRTFLYAVTVNALIDFVRRNRKHTVGRVSWETIDLETLKTSPDEGWDLAYRSALWQRIVGPLKSDLIRENPIKWSSFELHRLAGKPAKDVAAELNITIELVYQNVSRVMKQARSLCLAISDEELVDER